MATGKRTAPPGERCPDALPLAGSPGKADSVGRSRPKPTQRQYQILTHRKRAPPGHGRRADWPWRWGAIKYNLIDWTHHAAHTSGTVIGWVLIEQIAGGAISGLLPLPRRAERV